MAQLDGDNNCETIRTESGGLVLWKEIVSGKMWELRLPLFTIQLLRSDDEWSAWNPMFLSDLMRGQTFTTLKECQDAAVGYVKNRLWRCLNDMTVAQTKRL